MQALDNAAAAAGVEVFYRVRPEAPEFGDVHVGDFVDEGADFHSFSLRPA